MKVIKKIGKILLWIVAAIVVLLLASPLWLGPLGKGIANSVVPGIVGTDFRLGRLSINQYTGGLSVGDVKLANPEGFSKENCLELGSLDVNVAMTSLLSKKIRIEEIVLDGLLVASTLDGGNFAKIAENAAGADRQEASGAPEARPAADAMPAEPEKTSDAGAEADGEKVGLQIDRLVLRNITIKYGMAPIKIPFEIKMEGIGADKEEGATLSDIWNTVKDKVWEAAGAVGDIAGAAVGAVGDAAGAVIGAAGDAAGAAVGAVGDAAGAAAGAVGDAAGAAGDAAGAVIDAAGDAAGAAVDAVGGAAGAAVDAVGNAAGAAANAVKGLFK